MKTRSDFVSNSSSCSFVIHVKTEEDAAHLRSLYDSVLKKKSLTSCTSAKSAMDGFYGCDNLGVHSADDIQPHMFLFVDNGEDHYAYCFEDLYALADKLNEGYDKLKYYMDNDAHISLGDELKEDIEA